MLSPAFAKIHSSDSPEKLLADIMLSVPSGPSYNFDQLLVEILRYMQTITLENYDRLQALSHAVTLRPSILHVQKCEEQLKKGEALLAENKIADAVVAFENAIILDPLQFKAFQACAKAYKKLGNEENYNSYLNKALFCRNEENKKKKTIDDHLVLLQKQLDTFNESLDEKHQISMDQINPQLLAGWTYLGDILFQINESDLALRCYTKALTCWEYDYQSLVNRARIYTQLKQVDQFTQDYTKIILYFPDTELAWGALLMRAISLGISRDFSNARLDYLTYLKDTPADQFYKSNNKQNLKKECASYIQKFEEQRLNNAEHKKLPKRIQDLTKHIATELKVVCEGPDQGICRHVKNKNESLIGNYISRGSAFEGLGEYDEAINDYTMALFSLHIRNVTFNSRTLPFDMLVKRRNLYLELNNIKKCFQDQREIQAMVKRIVEVDQRVFSVFKPMFEKDEKKFIDRLINKGKEYLFAGILEEAVTYFTIAIEIPVHTKYSMPYLERAVVYWQSEMFEEAINDLNLAEKYAKGEKSVTRRIQSLRQILVPAEVKTELKIEPQPDVISKKKKRKTKKSQVQNHPSHKRSEVSLKTLAETQEKNRLEKEKREKEHLQESARIAEVIRLSEIEKEKTEQQKKEDAENKRVAQNLKVAEKRQANHGQLVEAREEKKKLDAAESVKKELAAKEAEDSKQSTLPSQKMMTLSPQSFFNQTAPKVDQKTSKEILLKCPVTVGIVDLNIYEKICISRLKNVAETYSVGGSVLKRIKKIPLSKHDEFDLVTAASREKILETFSDFNLYENPNNPNHFKLFAPGGIKIEIWRSEHLAQSLHQDAMNRDFKDKVCYLDENGRVITLIPGFFLHLEDEEEIHTVVPAKQSFTEDPSRVFRAIDYSTKSGKRFSLELKTAIEEMPSDSFNNIDPGKINAWFFKLFLFGKAEQNFNALLQYQMIDKLFPTIANALRGESKWISSELQRLDAEQRDIDEKWKKLDSLSSSEIKKLRRTDQERRMTLLHQIYMILITSAIKPPKDIDQYQYQKTVKTMIDHHPLLKTNFMRGCDINTLRRIAFWRWNHIRVEQIKLSEEKKLTFGASADLKASGIFSSTGVQDGKSVASQVFLTPSP